MSGVLVMASIYPPSGKGSEKGRHRSLSQLPDDDGFDPDRDVLRLLEENARLRQLVTQLSTLVLKHVVDPK